MRAMITQMTGSVSDPDYDHSTQGMIVWRGKSQVIRFADGKRRIVRTGDHVLVRQTGPEDGVILQKITIQ